MAARSKTPFRGVTISHPSLAEGLSRPIVSGNPDEETIAAMTPDRFRECLAALHWSQRGLAEILYCDDRLVRRWAQGTEPIPQSIARWIEELAGAHDAFPPPR